MAKNRKRIKDAYADQADQSSGKKGGRKRQKRSVTFFRHFIIGFFVFMILLFSVQMGLDRLGSVKFLAKNHVQSTSAVSAESDSVDGSDSNEPSSLNAAGNAGDSSNGSGGDQLQMPTEAVNRNSPFYKEFTDKNRVNILLLGVNGGMTDTIMLGSYDMDDQKVDVISVPRDTYYDRKGVTVTAAKKINAIYHNDGAVGTAQAVSKVLEGIPINYYVVIDYKGVGKVVDAMGGVPMDIPIHMYYHDPYDKPPLSIDIPKGHQLLNGTTAIQFLRFRHGDPGYPQYPRGDIDRIAAQQKFIKSALKQSIGPQLPKVIKTAVESVDSNITLGEALKITAKAAGLTPSDLTSYTVPGEAVTIDGLSFWKTDASKTKQMLIEIFAGLENDPAAALKGSVAVRKVMK